MNKIIFFVISFVSICASQITLDAKVNYKYSTRNVIIDGVEKVLYYDTVKINSDSEFKIKIDSNYTNVSFIEIKNGVIVKNDTLEIMEVEYNYFYQDVYFETYIKTLGKVTVYYSKSKNQIYRIFSDKSSKDKTVKTIFCYDVISGSDKLFVKDKVYL